MEYKDDHDSLVQVLSRLGINTGGWPCAIDVRLIVIKESSVNRILWSNMVEMITYSINLIGAVAIHSEASVDTSDFTAASITLFITAPVRLFNKWQDPFVELIDKWLIGQPDDIVRQHTRLFHSRSSCSLVGFPSKRVGHGDDGFTCLGRQDVADHLTFGNVRMGDGKRMM